MAFCGWLVRVGSSVVVAALTACGDDGGNATDNKTLGALSSEETAQVCETMASKYARFEASFVSVSCTQDALAEPATCSTARAKCIKDTPAAGSLNGKITFSCSGSDDSVSTTCANATVAEVESCMDAIVDVVAQLAGQFTCTSDPSALKPPATPKACSDLGTRCPMLSEFSLN